MKARVYVTLKPSVFDPQGSTIADALHSLGYSTVADVRQGKFFELDLDVDYTAYQAVEEMDGITTNVLLVTAHDGDYVYAVSGITFGDDPVGQRGAIGGARSRHGAQPRLVDLHARRGTGQGRRTDVLRV